MTLTSKEIRLVYRPTGDVKPSNFSVVEVQVGEPGPGQIVVRNDWISVDPYMRGRMNDAKSYTPPFELDQPMGGGAVGTVVASTSDVPVGAVVLHELGWREYAVLDAGGARIVDVTRAEASEYLGVLGMTGLTAYVGLKVIAQVKPDDVVFISGAAGAVGLVAGVVARKLGASRVIGSAGGPEKVRRLVEEFGFDDAIDYRQGMLRQQLAVSAPTGIDVYFDNVGGDHLQAAISAMRLHGRIALCGAISLYNAEAPVPGPTNMMMMIGKRLSLRGYLVFDHYDLTAEYLDHALAWLADGSLRSEQTIVEGIENATTAFIDMLAGANTGKMLVRLS